MKAPVVVLVVFALALALSSEAVARRGVPIQNYENIPIVRADNVVLTSAKVREAIVRGTQRNKWIVTEDGPETIVATFSIRGKHSLTVEVRYTSTYFSINYRDSSNLNYKQGANGPEIHPAYNQQVKALLDAINAELAQGH